MKVETRILTQEEKAQAGFVSSICFHARFDEDLAKREEEWMQSVSEIWGAVNNGKVLSVVYNNKSTCFFEGNKIGQVGVGGVSTLPEARNLGLTKEVITALLKEEYKRGSVISTLYPFSTSFYRKYGYEVAVFKNVYELKPSFLKDYKFDGEVIMYKPGEEYQEYVELFESFTKNYNLCVERNQIAWGWKMPKNIFKDRKFAYLLKENDEAIAYIIFKDKESDDAIIDIQEVIWKDRRGFEAILGFLARFSADYGKIKLPLPINIELNSIIHTSKCYQIEKQTHIGYMVRALNAKRALELIKKPVGCDFTISIKDNIIKANNKTYHVTNYGVEETEEKADICTEIQGFSQLVFGIISMDEAKLRSDVSIVKNEEELRRVFVKKPYFITQYF